jgi:hypothetical protein
VGALRDTTGDCPGSSAIYVDFMKPRCLYDELRAVKLFVEHYRPVVEEAVQADDERRPATRNLR